MDVLLDYNDPSIKDLVYVKTNIGGWFFDAFLQTDYERSLTITENPVETGASISDHSFVNPVKLVFQIGMSDVATSIIDGQFSGGSTRSLQAFQVLANLQQQRIPSQVMTRLGGFRNMLVETLSVSDDYKTLNGLKASVTMKEIIVAQATTVKLSANAQVTDSTNRGPIEPVAVSGSNFYQMLVLVMGKDKADAFIKQLNGKNTSNSTSSSGNGAF